MQNNPLIRIGCGNLSKLSIYFPTRRGRERETVLKDPLDFTCLLPCSIYPPFCYLPISELWVLISVESVQLFLKSQHWLSSGIWFVSSSNLTLTFYLWPWVFSDPIFISWSCCPARWLRRMIKHDTGWPHVPKAIALVCSEEFWQLDRHI